MWAKRSCFILEAGTIPSLSIDKDTVRQRPEWSVETHMLRFCGRRGRADVSERREVYMESRL
jgi:hypothetical protein